MIKISVKTTTVETVKWKDKQSGVDRQMDLQPLFVFLTNSDGKIDDYPEKITTPVNENPIPVGDYTLTPQSIYLDRNRRLAISLNDLKPLQQAQKAA